MKRIIDHFLLKWKSAKTPRPLILRGARQVGKTYAVRQLGKTFSSFVEINLETNEVARTILSSTLDIEVIMLKLGEASSKPIIAGETLLFLDEVQHAPQAITALRYFYEQRPGLHVIAAGSLLDFALEQISVPVGRVTFLRMYPLSFLEFLTALGHPGLVSMILRQTAHNPDSVNKALHEKLLSFVGLYLAIGGMPSTMTTWLEEKTSHAVRGIHEDLIFTYRQDFGKYAKKHQIKYLELILQHALNQLGGKFMFARVGEYKKRELEPAVELLEKAGLLHKVFRSGAQGVPLGAHAFLDTFKLIFMDVGLCQTLLKNDLAAWLINPDEAFSNSGALTEAFVGQELLAYSDPIQQEQLFYWHRFGQSREAEVDYVVQLKQSIIPIEVKAGSNHRLQSMQLFLEEHATTPYGLRFSTLPYNIRDSINSYPLYAIAKPLLDTRPEMQAAIEALIAPE